MPVGHVVTFGCKANTQPEAILALGAALDELASETSALSYHHGADLNIRQGNADYSVTATFEDEDAFSASITSAHHLQIVRELPAPHLESRSTVQFAIAP